MITKTCRVCHETKDIELFYKDKLHKVDGRKNDCMSCNRAYNRWYESTPIGRRNLKIKVTKYRKLNPEPMIAQSKVKYAVTTGKLIKPERCPACNGEGRIEAHHEDYSKPLDVMWLCNVCHKAHHGRIRDKGLLRTSPPQPNHIEGEDDE